MALHSLYCADVPWRNCSLTHSLDVFWNLGVLSVLMQLVDGDTFDVRHCKRCQVLQNCFFCECDLRPCRRGPKSPTSLSDMLLQSHRSTAWPGHFRSYSRPCQWLAAAWSGSEPTVWKLYERQASGHRHPSSSTSGDSLLNKINTIFIKVQPSCDGVPRQCHMSCLATSRDIFSCLCLQIVVPV